MAAETRDVREGREIAIAVHGDYLAWYLNEWERLYECDHDIDRASTLVDVLPEIEREFIDSADDNVIRSRRHKVVSIVHNFREARFRPMVLRAYSFRCCVSGVSLRLVDAAHIIPVSDPLSTDDVSNGLALNPLYHRAYDNGLFGVMPNGRTAFNERIASKLRRDNLAHGLAELRRGTPPEVSLPGITELRPRPDRLAKGLLLRGWLAEEIDALSA